MPAEHPAIVVVSGSPGAGKTTVARRLRDDLGLPLLAKDELKETLGDVIDVAGDRERSRELGVAVFGVLRLLARELLESGVSLIVEGNFRPGSPALDGLPPARVVEVHLTARPDVIRARLLARDAHRHPVHYDAEAADEIAATVYAPLFPDAITIDTSDGFPGAHELRARVEARLHG